jgi:hypothetical protein
MKNQFATTSNVERFLAAMAALKHRGASEASWILLTGLPGLGKTELVEWWALRHDAIYLRAKAAWTPRSAMIELAEKLGIAPARTSVDLFGQILSVLGRTPAPVVVDEIEHCLRDAKVLEIFRDLSDLTEIPVVVVGMDAVRTQIQRYEQISSRIHQVVDILPAIPADVRLMAETLVEVPLVWADDLIHKIHVESEGRYRLIMDALAEIERQAKRNGLTAVNAADFPQKLTHDWRVRAMRRPSKAEKIAPTGPVVAIARNGGTPA